MPSTPNRPPRTARPRRSWGHSIVGIGIVAIAATVLAACSSGSSKSASSSGASGASGSSSASASGTVTPKEGGTVTMVQDGIPGGLDPATNKIWSFSDGPIMAALYGELVYEDPATGKAEYGFLSGMTSNADFTVWTLKLKPNLMFSDGTPFDAAAIMYNWQRINDPATASPVAAVTKTFTNMQVIDSTTLQVTLQAPVAAFPNVVAESLACIGSPTAMKSEGVLNYGLHPVGAGPFKFKSLVANTSAVLVKNPGYAAYAPGQPYLDQINFQYLPDIGQQVTALQNGQAQIARPSGGGANKQFTDVGLNDQINYTSGGQNVTLNNSIAPFNDPRARQALTLALDRTPAADAFAVGTPPMTNLFATTSPYYDPKYNLPAQDTAKAQQLFNELAADGKPFDITLETIASPLQAPFANYLVAALGSFKNTKVTIKALPSAQYATDLRAGTYQMIVNGLYMIAGAPDGTDWFTKNGINNTFKWNNPTAEAALQEILKTDPTNVALLKKDWGIVQQQLLNDDPVVWFGKGVLGFVTSKDIVNAHPINYGIYPLWGEVGYKA